jgi:hypothetical protein
VHPPLLLPSFLFGSKIFCSPWWREAKALWLDCQPFRRICTRVAIPSSILKALCLPTEVTTLMGSSSLDVDVDVDGGNETVFCISDSWKKFFNTSLLGAIITRNIASISWQLVALAFPVTFLTNSLFYVLLRLCLIL